MGSPLPLLLLVEDNPDDATLVRRALDAQGVRATVEVVTDGVTALERLRPPPGSRARVPALVLLDLDLPELHGVEVLRRLRADAPTATPPVVVLTASGDPGDEVRCRELGVQGYHRKPIQFADLQAIVERLARRWLAGPVEGGKGGRT
jgi:two-component system response regulator